MEKSFVGSVKGFGTSFSSEKDPLKPFCLNSDRVWTKPKSVEFEI